MNVHMMLLDNMGAWHHFLLWFVVMIKLLIDSFVKTGPHIFREGDIVEVQVTIVVTPIRNGQRKLRVVLHSIALVNGSYGKVNMYFLCFEF